MKNFNLLKYHLLNFNVIKDKIVTRVTPVRQSLNNFTTRKEAL